MFLSSVVLYLVTRRSTLEKTPTVWNNLAGFLPAIPIYLIMTYLNGQTVRLNFAPEIWLLFIFSSVFFSYLGNVMSLKSIEVAPNVGFSLTLSKSYVVLTTLVSVVLFHAALSWLAIIAIGCIIGFSALISIDQKPSTNPNIHPRWLPLAIGSFFSWGLLSLSSKYLYTIGVTVFERLLISMSIVSLIILTELVTGKHSWRTVTKAQWWCLALIGLTGASFNYFMQLALTSAPNIGYVNAINAASLSVVTLLSAWFFHDELPLRKIIGVFGVSAGLILLVLGS